MKDDMYYVTSILVLLISLMGFYQRDYVSVKIHPHNYILTEAEITMIHKNIFLSETKIIYFVEGKMYSDKISYDTMDEIGAKIDVYYNLENKDAKRATLVKDFNKYFVLIIVTFVVLCIALIVVRKTENISINHPILYVVFVFDVYLLFGTYSAIKKDEEWRLWIMIMVWSVGMSIFHKLLACYSNKKTQSSI